MDVFLEVRRNTDGVVRKEATPFDWDDADPDADFVWSEGNYACDCNRRIFFHGGKMDPHLNPCGSTEFSVRLRDEAGKVVYQDGDGWQE